MRLAQGHNAVPPMRTKRMGLSIICSKGSLVKILYYNVFLSLKNSFLANIVDTDEMLHFPNE